MKRIADYFKLFPLLLIIIPSAYSSKITIECKLLNDDICSSKVNITERETPIQRKLDDNDYTAYKVLLFKDAVVNYIPMKINVSFPELTSLKVMNSSLLEIQKNNFDGLEKITEVNFEDNLIAALKEDVFESLECLKKLNLDRNQISSIPSKIFSKNSKLTEISLLKNNISSINDQTFKNLKSLKILHISFNQLEDLRSGTFDDCTDLTRIYINNNNLKYVPANIFKHNKKLRFSIGYFRNNKCIDEYASGKEINSLSDLNEAFLESCKPPNQDLIDELTRQVEELTKINEEVRKELDVTKSKLKQTTNSYEICKVALNSKDSEIEEEKKEKKTVEEKFNDFKTTAEKKEEELTKGMEKLQKKVDKMEEDRISLSSSTDEFNTKIQNQTMEIKILEEEVFIFKKSWFNCQKQMNLTSENLLNEVKKSTYFDDLSRNLSTQVDHLKTDLTVKDKIITDNADLVEKSKTELIRKEFLISMLFENIRKANETIGNLTAGKYDADAISSITNPIATEFYNIECSFSESKFIVGGSADSSFYTCNINELKVLSCRKRLNDISNSPDGKIVNSLAFDRSYLIEFPREVAEKFKNLKNLTILNSSFWNFVENFCGLSNDFEYVQIINSHVGHSITIGNCLTLKQLKIQNSGIKEIRAEIPIKSLTDLVLKNNKIEKISKEFLSKFENLKNIQLSGNQITQLHQHTFDGNKNLGILNLSFNPIKTIGCGIFSKNHKLIIIDLKESSLIDQTVSGAKDIDALKVKLITSCTL